MGMQWPPRRGRGRRGKPKGLVAATAMTSQDVDAHLVADDGHFVGEGAVDDPEGVLQDLGHLRFLGCGDGEYGCLENCLVECLGVFRTGGVQPPTTLGVFLVL